MLTDTKFPVNLNKCPLLDIEAVATPKPDGNLAMDGNVPCSYIIFLAHCFLLLKFIISSLVICNSLKSKT